MRPLIASALLAAAGVVGCGGGERANPPASRTASTLTRPRGIDALLLRVPRAGGGARVVAYPSTDSTVWTSTGDAPALDHMLGLDRDAGTLAAVDRRGEPLWLDLRTGDVTVATRKPLRDVTSNDGSTIYGIGTDGAVARFTPSGNWVFKPPRAARAIFPEPGGTLLVLGGRGDQALLWRIHPPASKILDSLAVRGAVGGTGGPLGDRIFLTTAKHALVGVRPRAMTITRTISFDYGIRALVTTASGDRFYVIADSSNEMTIVDPYQDRIAKRIALPGRARDVRVDPFGRYVLVRPATGDSVWVVGIGTDRVFGSVRTQWRGDVPFVAPDGAVAVTDGSDLVFVDGASLKEVQRVGGGASDFWYPFVWDGFRPRASALDTLARFPGDSDSTTAAVMTPPDTAHPKAAPVDSVRLGFTVSFASLLDEAKARDQANKISVNGQTARVVTTMTSGMAVYRVVLGPYPTRDEADRAGRASGQSYYVYAGAP
ncbi:MAG: SPOR domain-containing protein [Gemmatimonadales bacterium]